jgi:ribosomal protein L11 methylase PrmA
MSLENQILGSFRDPFGSVFEIRGRVFRGIKKEKDLLVHKFLGSSFYKKNVGKQIVKTKEISKAEVLEAGISLDVINKFSLWVEHERIDFITYPYEWSFEFLRCAAIFYLDLYVEALENGFQIKDASAYNIQFLGLVPIFIDTLSFESYCDGDKWIGYKQFCEQFLAPLAVSSYCGVDFNPWLRGSPDGLSIIDCSKLLPLKSLFSLTLIGNIHIQAMCMSRISATTSKINYKTQNSIPKKNLIAFLRSLKRFIKKLKAPKESYWNRYDLENSYSDNGTSDKEKIVKRFVESKNLKNILDVGCNSGHFSQVALMAGANRVIGLDIDSGAINLASKKITAPGKLFTPLLYDFTNPSPAMGWNLEERASLESRIPEIDGVICLALIHHIVIAKNIPIRDFIEWITKLSPNGLIEFVPKDDPMVIGLLASREDVFPNYSENYFLESLANFSNIEQVISLNNSKRKFILYEKK